MGYLDWHKPHPKRREMIGEKTHVLTNGLWRLELNAYGIVPGATAIGHIRNT